VTDPRPGFEVITFPSARELARRMPRLLVGIVLLGVGIGVMVQARLGPAPWDVLHQGIAHRTGLSIGVVIIALGAAILLLWIPLRQRIGIGTVVNTLIVGLVADVTIEVIGSPNGLALRWVLLLGGLVVEAFGMSLYISAGLGPGPRDGLMTGIASKGFSIWVVRTLIELVALAIGYALGGDIGAGTVIFAFAIGPLGHWFIERLHLRPTGTDLGTDLGPGTAAE
jgi:uncharacterized membrane protein YczE